MVLRSQSFHNALGTGVLTFLGTPSSANLKAAVTDETGSGALVFGTAPTLTGVTINDTASLTVGDSSGEVGLGIGLSETINSAGATEYYGILNYTDVTHQYSASAGTEGYGASFNAKMKSTVADPGYLGIYGAYIRAERNASGDLGTANTYIIGLTAASNHGTSGTAGIVTDLALGVQSQHINVIGTMTDAALFRGSIQIGADSGKNAVTTTLAAFDSGTGTIGRAAGNTATVTTYYGLRLRALTVNATGTLTTKYGIYQEGATYNNVFQGPLVDPVLTVATPATTSIGYLGIPQIATQTDYTLALTDSGKQYYHVSGSTHTLTIPANASVAFPIGTVVMIINENGGGNLSVAITTDTLRWEASTGTRTLAANGVATITKVTATLWRMTGTGIS